MRYLCSVLALAGVALLWAACSDSGPTSPGDGTLEVFLTDAPTDQLAEINVCIVGLTVKPADRGIVRIASDLGVVDLLELRDARRLLAAAGLRPGRYVHVRIELDQDCSNVVEAESGEEKPLQIASEEIKVLGGFDVNRGGTTSVTLDFDALESIRQKGNGDWLLVPIIIQTQVESR